MLVGCSESSNENSDNASIEDRPLASQSQGDSLSSYSKCLGMLNEYESILDELQSLSLAVESKNLEALSNVTEISKKATQWVEKWKKAIQNQDLTSNEIDQLIQAYQDLLSKYN